jgi:predicted DNA-binding protein (UPF0278 family)
LGALSNPRGELAKQVFKDWSSEELTVLLLALELKEAVISHQGLEVVDK